MLGDGAEISRAYLQVQWSRLVRSLAATKIIFVVLQILGQRDAINDSSG